MWLFSSPAGVLILIGIIYGIWKLVKEIDTQTYASHYKKYAEEHIIVNTPRNPLKSGTLRQLPDFFMAKVVAIKR